METKETTRGIIICAYCGEAGHTQGKCVARMSDEAEARAVEQQSL